MRIAALALLALLAGSSSAAEPPLPAIGRCWNGHGAATRSHEPEGACRSGGRTQETRVPCGLSGEPLPEKCARSETDRGAQSACARASGAPARARRKAPPGGHFGAGFGRAKPHPTTAAPPLRIKARTNNRFRKPPPGHRSQPSRPCGAGCSAAFSGTGGRGAARCTKRRPIGSDTTPGCEATRRSNQRARQRNSGTGSDPAASRVASSTRPRPSVLAR